MFSKQELYYPLLSEMRRCRKCSLYKTREYTVVGVGSLDSALMIVGEAPGKNEDLNGKPFIGQAGKILSKILIATLGIEKEDTFITNVVKCRPPGNRNPKPDEIEKCSPYLMRQIEIIIPKVIITLGAFSAQTLLQSEQKITDLRTQPHLYLNIPLIATFHPMYARYNPSSQKYMIADFDRVKDLL